MEASSFFKVEPQQMFHIMKMFMDPSLGLAATQTPAKEPSAQLRELLDSIPYANDGDVITPDHHNTLRSALARIAGALDESQYAGVFTKSFAPTLLPTADDIPTWRQVTGAAAGPKGATEAISWMPLEMPHGADVDHAVVRGALPSTVTVSNWNVSVVRRELVGTQQQTICNAKVTKPASGDAFAVTLRPESQNLSPAELGERRRIDASRYAYYFLTDTEMTRQSDALRLDLVQITFTRG